MAEPKKETVRIVLPPRRDGQPLASNPRETAMINLPPKPVQKAAGGAPAPTPQTAPVIPPAPVMPPAPPSGVSAPKPPSAPPRPPGAVTPPSAPPKPATVPPVPPTSGPKPPAPAIVTPAITPAPLSTESKKETAKVPVGGPGAKPMPQATVQLTKQPASASKSVAPGAAINIVPPTTAPSENEVSPLIGGLALAASLVAMGIQVVMMLG